MFRQCVINVSTSGNIRIWQKLTIKWNKYEKTVQEYKTLQKQYKLLKLNFWTTVSSLNVADMPNILDFALKHNIDHAWAFLNNPRALDVKYKNKLTKQAKKKLSTSTYNICKDIAKKIAIDTDNTEQLALYIKRQDYIRKININDYFNFDENLFSNSSAKPK